LHIVFIQSASSAEELKAQTSVKVGGDGLGHMETKSFNKELDLTSSGSGLTVPPSESSVLPVVGTSEADSTSVNAADVPSTDISSPKSSAKSTGEPQGVESLGVAAVESKGSEITRKISPDFGEEKISSQSTENESHEVCTMDLAEQAPVATSKLDNSDATSCVTDQQEILKESTPSIPEEYSAMNRSHKNTEALSDVVDDNAVSAANSETSSEPTIQSASDKADTSSIQETGLTVSSITPDMLPATHSVASEGQEKHVGEVKDQSSAALTASFDPYQGKSLPWRSLGQSLQLVKGRKEKKCFQKLMLPGHQIFIMHIRDQKNN